MTPRLYLAAGVLSAVLVAAGVFWLQAHRVDALRAENAALRLSVDACKARTDNISQDKESDDAVDNIPDDGLRNAPDDWMFPPGSGGIY